MAHDWVRYKLTGEFGAEITNISGSNLYNVDTGAYEPELFKLFGIEEMQDSVAPVIGSTESRAGISAKASEETGLLAGTPVYGGFFDVVSAAVCAGLADERFINVVMGTWNDRNLDRRPHRRCRASLHLGPLLHPRQVFRA